MSFVQFQVALAVVMAIPIGVGIIGCWRLCRRLGLPGWSSLIVLVPVVNLAAVYWVAFFRRRPGVTCARGYVATGSAPLA
jgi:hypothetical protein